MNHRFLNSSRDARIAQVLLIFLTMMLALGVVWATWGFGIMLVVAAVADMMISFYGRSRRPRQRVEAIRDAKGAQHRRRTHS